MSQQKPLEHHGVPHVLRKPFVMWAAFVAALLVLVGTVWAGVLLWQTPPASPHPDEAPVPMSAQSSPVIVEELVDIEHVDAERSADYQRHASAIEGVKAEWLKIKAEMEADGASPEEIALAADYFSDMMISTIMLKMRFESTLTDEEAGALLQKLLVLALDKEFVSAE